MKKVSTKILSLFLSLVLILGTVTVAFAADEAPAAPAVKYGLKYFQSTNDKSNAKGILDMVDAKLKESDMEAMELKVGAFTFTIDFTSVNGICKTIDTVYGLWGDYDLFGNWLPRLGSTVLVGDLGGKDGLEFKHWTKGMSREKSGDVAILKNLITLLADNEHIIRLFIDGKIDLGTLGVALKAMDVDVEKIFADLYGDGDFSTMLKKGIVSAVYDEQKQPAEYKAGLAKAMNSLDDFFYEDMMSDLLSEILPDFSVNGKTTFDELINSVFNTYWPELVKQIAKINVDTVNTDSEALKKLGEIMVLDGHKIHVEIPYNPSEPFASQVNGIIGYMAKQFFPQYTGWVDGNASKLGANLNALYLYVAESLGILDGIDQNNSSAVAFAVVQYILDSINSEDVNAYVNGIKNCDNLEQAAAVVIRNTATINNIPVTADTNATYEQLVGDIINFYAGKSIELGYGLAAGKDMWTVINDIANVFLFDRGFAKAFNFPSDITRKSAVFEKLDELINKTEIFKGLTGTNDYTSKTFLTGIINSLFTLDIAKLVDITVVTFLKDFSGKSVANTAYDAVYNFLKNWLGKDILKKRTSEKPIDDAVSNASIKTLITNLLTSINEKKDNLLPAILYIGAAVIGKVPAKYEFKLDNLEYTGKELKPTAVKASLDGKAYTLKPDRDFDIVSLTGDLVNPGIVTAKINLYGYAEATLDLTYKITLPALKNLKATATTNSATLTWDKVDGAQKYEVLDGSKVIATTEATTATVSLATATEYKLSVRAAYNDERSASASVTVVTLPNKAATPSVSDVTDTSLKLAWTATENATGYEIEKLNGSNWTKIATVNALTYNVSGLGAKTACQFRIRAYKQASGKPVYGEYSDAASATTLLSATKLAVSSVTDTSAVLSWTAVAGAEGYSVEKLDASKWSAIGTTAATTYTVTNLNADSSAQFRVVAYYKSGANTVYGIASSPVTATTTITKTDKVTATVAGSDSVKVTWSAVAGATGYTVFYSTNNKSWKSVTATKTSVTLTKLSPNTKYYIKVQAYKKSGSTTVKGPDSATVDATTLLATPVLKASSADSATVKLTWNKLSGASGYVLEKYDGKKWVAVKTTTATSFTVTKLKANTTYQFRVKGYVKSGSKNVYSAYSTVLKVSTAPTKTSKVTAKTAGSATIKVTWKKVTGATSYRVYYSTNNKSWKSVTSKKTSVTLSKLSANKKYYIKVQALKKTAGITAAGSYSATVNATTRIAQVTGLKASKTTKNSITLTWKKVSGASGYTVYRQNGKKWVKVATVKSNSYTNKKLSRNTSYSYYVVAYKTVSKKAVYGDKSATLKVRTKLF